MTACASFDRAIVGAGPTGLMAALQSSKSARTLLIFDKPPASDPLPRIETVPAALVNLMIDFGIHPKRLGIDQLYDTRCVAWQSRTPETIRGRSVAHIDHGALQAELFSAASRNPDLSLRIESHLPVKRGLYWYGTGWRARTLLDATGRLMVFANRRVQPPKPWVARSFWTAKPPAASDRPLRIAALPYGYAYRLGSRHVDSVWIVGRGPSLRRSPAAFERSVKEAGASWLLDGFPPLESATTGRAYPASVQWAESSLCTPIGDAALSRDILSSQGLATGISDALLAIASNTNADAALCADRQRAERAAHLRSLAGIIATCRYRHRRNWDQYGNFVTSHQVQARESEGVALISGRVVRKSLGELFLQPERRVVGTSAGPESRTGTRRDLYLHRDVL